MLFSKTSTISIIDKEKAECFYIATSGEIFFLKNIKTKVCTTIPELEPIKNELSELLEKLVENVNYEFDEYITPLLNK